MALFYNYFFDLDQELPLLELDNSKRMAAITRRVHLASELERLEYQLRKVCFVAVEF